MSTYNDCNDSEQYPTCYSLTEFSVAYIKENKPAWRIKGQQHRYLRESMHINHYELAKCLGISPSVILAFENGQPVQRPRFVENAYRTAISSFFYRHYYFANKFYPKFLQPILKLEDLIANLCYEQTLSLGSIYSLVDTFKFKEEV